MELLALRLHRLIGCLLGLCCTLTQVQASDAVTVQLRWHHQFQFAGYYAALEQGYYQAEGLDVTLRAGDPQHQPVTQVLSGQAQYGVGNSEVLQAYLQGESLLALAAVFQHSPSVLLTTNPALRSAHDLIGKKVMLLGGSADADFLTMLRSEGIQLDQVHIIPSSFELDDLIAGRVDAFNSYSSNEPFYLRERGISYSIIDPRSYRVDFYSDIFFTTAQELHQHPERVSAMRRATLKGWQYAMAHPEEIIELLLSKYQVNKTRAHLEYEAKSIDELILPNLIEIGHMNPGRWQHMADTLLDADMVDKLRPLDDFIYQYDRSQESESLRQLLRLLAITTAIIAALGGLIVYISRTNQQLRQSLDQVDILRTAMEQSPTSILVTDPDCAILYVNPYFEQETGYSSEEVVGKNPSILNSGQTAEEIYHNMWQTLARGKSWRGEFINKRKSGETYCEEAHIAPVLNAAGNVKYYVAVKLNIDQRKQAEQQIRQLALHDSLTGIANRRLLNERLLQTLAYCKRHSQYAALLFLDLDNFKPLNDKHGHAVGDKLLIEVTRRLQASLRETDTVARFGGDEFVILLARLGQDQQQAAASALQLAEKIRITLSQSFLLQSELSAGKTIAHQCTVSIGATIFGAEEREIDSIIMAADSAMYRAKTAGRNVVVMHTETRDTTCS